MRLGALIGIAVVVAALGGGASAAPHANFEIFAIGTDGRNRVQLTTNPGWDLQPAVAPNGRTIAFIRSEPGSVYFDLWSMDADGGNQRLVVHLPGQVVESPRWAPNGRLIAFTAYNSGACSPGGRNCATRGVFVVRPDGSGLREVSHSGNLGSQHPVWSPDSRRLLVESDVVAMTPSQGLSVVNADGSGERTLIDDFRSPPPTWLPNAREFAFSRRGGVWIRNVRTGRQRRLTRLRGRPVWAPRGPLVLIERWPSLVIVRSDTKSRRSLGRGTAGSWSPSGDRVAFLTRQIEVARANGRGRRPVTSEPIASWGRQEGRLSPAAWSRDGRRLYYAVVSGT